METKVDFLAIGELGTGENVQFVGSGAVFEVRAWKLERPACAGRLAASPVAEPLVELNVA